MQQYILAYSTMNTISLDWNSFILLLSLQQSHKMIIPMYIT